MYKYFVKLEHKTLRLSLFWEGVTKNTLNLNLFCEFGTQTRYVYIGFVKREHRYVTITQLFRESGTHIRHAYCGFVNREQQQITFTQVS